MFVQSRECQGGEDDLPPTRLGITVTRKVGNAVERNHIKRMVRDVFRQEQCDLPAGLDMVWVAKRQAAGVAHEQVRADFLQLQRALPRPGVDSSVVVLDAGSGTLSPGPAATSGSGMGGRK